MQANEVLIQNCLQILLNQGIRVSMDDIAKELSMSKRTLYELFENKNELIYKCIVLFIKEENKKMEDYLSKNHSNIIEELFPLLNLDIYNMTKDRHYFLHDLKRYYPDIHDKIIANHKDFFMSRISKIINKGVEQGFFKKETNTDIVNAFLLYLFTPPNNGHKEILAKYSIPEIFENTVLCYVRGFSTQKGLDVIEQTLKVKKWNTTKIEKTWIIQ